MDGVRNKTRFAIKRYSDKIKAEKRQIHLNKQPIKKWNEKNKNKSNRKTIEEEIRQHESNKKRELKNIKEHKELNKERVWKQNEEKKI